MSEVIEVERFRSTRQQLMEGGGAADGAASPGAIVAAATARLTLVRVRSNGVRRIDAWLDGEAAAVIHDLHPTDETEGLRLPADRCEIEIVRLWSALLGSLSVEAPKDLAVEVELARLAGYKLLDPNVATVVVATVAQAGIKERLVTLQHTKGTASGTASGDCDALVAKGAGAMEAWSLLDRLLFRWKEFAIQR